jgi:hypothetical protein
VHIHPSSKKGSRPSNASCDQAQVAFPSRTHLPIYFTRMGSAATYRLRKRRLEPTTNACVCSGETKQVVVLRGGQHNSEHRNHSQRYKDLHAHAQEQDKKGTDAVETNPLKREEVRRQQSNQERLTSRNSAA